MDITTLVKVTSRAWSLDILTHLHNRVAGRQSALLSATGAGRTAFGQSLTHLIDLELVERNPGHGHPLRPEFRLTEAGSKMAGIASRVMAIGQNTNNPAVLRRSWNLPILAISRRPLHFKDIKLKLPTITDRALSQSLRSLENCNWMTRDIDSNLRPPRPLYSAANEGARISAITQSFAA